MICSVCTLWTRAYFYAKPGSGEQKVMGIDKKRWIFSWQHSLEKKPPRGIQPMWSNENRPVSVQGKQLCVNKLHLNDPTWYCYGCSLGYLIDCNWWQNCQQTNHAHNLRLIDWSLNRQQKHGTFFGIIQESLILKPMTFGDSCIFRSLELYKKFELEKKGDMNRITIIKNAR